jgi:hypothetical protein
MLPPWMAPLEVRKRPLDASTDLASTALQALARGGIVWPSLKVNARPWIDAESLEVLSAEDVGARKGFRRYRVSKVGQFTLSAGSRIQLRVQNGGHVNLQMLGDAAVVRPHRGGKPNRSEQKRGTVTQLKVSSSGQVVLPAAVRRTWGVPDGGFIEVAHCGDVVILLPGGGSAALVHEWLTLAGFDARANVFRALEWSPEQRDWLRAGDRPLNGSRRALVDGTALAQLLRGKPLDVFDAAIGSYLVTTAEYIALARKISGNTAHSDMPKVAAMIVEAAYGAIGGVDWLAFVLDLGRVAEFHGQVVELAGPEAEAAIDVAYAMAQTSLDERTATNLVIAQALQVPIIYGDDGTIRSLESHRASSDPADRGGIRVDANLLEELDITVDGNTANKLLKLFYEQLEAEAGQRIASLMTNDQLDEFEGFFETRDDAGALRWLEVTIPDYSNIVQASFEEQKAVWRRKARELELAAGSDSEALRHSLTESVGSFHVAGLSASRKDNRVQLGTSPRDAE